MFKKFLTKKLLINLNPKGRLNLIAKQPIRNYNIKSSTYIEKIGKHLIEGDEDQLIILNLPKEIDYNLPRYLIKNNRKNLLLLLDKSLKDETLIDDNNLNVVDNVDLLSLETFHKVDKGSEITIYSKIADKIKKREWTDKPAAKLFMIVPNNRKKILRSFIFQIKTFSYLFSNGRIELYLLLTDIEYNKIKINSSSNIFFTYTYEFLYDHKLLDQFKWSDLNITRSKQSFNMKKTCYFVRLTPKKSLDTDYTRDNLAFFIDFLGKLTTRKHFIIATFEAWFPGIGIKLIDEGYSVFTKFDDLKLCDYLKIYDLLMKEDSDTFQNILQTY